MTSKSASGESTLSILGRHVLGLISTELSLSTTAQAQRRMFQAQAIFVSQIDQLVGQIGHFDSQAEVRSDRSPARK